MRGDDDVIKYITGNSGLRDEKKKTKTISLNEISDLNPDSPDQQVPEHVNLQFRSSCECKLDSHDCAVCAAASGYCSPV